MVCASHAQSQKAGELLVSLANKHSAAIAEIEKLLAKPLENAGAQAGVSPRAFRTWFMDTAMRMHPGKYNDFLRAARRSSDPEVQKIADEVAGRR